MIWSFYMFKMYIKINTLKLISDGLKSSNDILLNIIKSIDSYNIVHLTTDITGNTEYCISTNKFGDESYLISLLED